MKKHTIAEWSGKEASFKLSNKEILLFINLLEETVNNKTDKEVRLLSSGLTKDDLRGLQTILDEVYGSLNHTFP